MVGGKTATLPDSKHAVVELLPSDGPGGTGFFVTEKLLITAHHVYRGGGCERLRYHDGATADFELQYRLIPGLDLTLGVLKSGAAPAHLLLPSVEAADAIEQVVFSRQLLIMGYGSNSTTGTPAEAEKRLRAGLVTASAVAGDGTELELSGNAWPCGGDSGGPVVPEELPHLAVGCLVKGDQNCDGLQGAKARAISLFDPDVRHEIETAAMKIGHPLP
ncbi:MAG TPA: serine protease [Thermoanaerobaculia bacterium]|nr:serine protease [Thermoanaerobaculia bacterium]